MYYKGHKNPEIYFVFCAFPQELLFKIILSRTHFLLDTTRGDDKSTSTESGIADLPIALSSEKMLNAFELFLIYFI